MSFWFSVICLEHYELLSFARVLLEFGAELVELSSWPKSNSVKSEDRPLSSANRISSITLSTLVFNVQHLPTQKDQALFILSG